MKKSVSPDTADQKRKKRTAIVVVLLALLVLLLFFLRGWLLSPATEPVKPTAQHGSKVDSAASFESDSGIPVDSLEYTVVDTGDSVTDTVGVAAVEGSADSAEYSSMKEESTKSRDESKNRVTGSSSDKAKTVADSGDSVIVDAPGASDLDLANVIYDSSESDTPYSDPCESDTIPPWVFADPAGGLHSSPPSVAIRADDSAVIEWRFGDEEQWKTYAGTPIPVTENARLVFRAVDDCGNTSEVRSEEYELSGETDEDHCPRGMTYIEISDARFCIDTYEWPNEKGARPQAFVSIYQAMDSCFTVGKRLCTTEEWSLACGGPYSQSYPYGDVYEPRACNTQDTTVARSGSCPECRGYFGVQDMSGNLAEWTDTRSSRNRQFYNVMGGFWTTGSNATCRNARYSYYPQNKHNPVGFRCCADAK